MTNDESLFWTFRDEGFYECLKTRYSDRVKLCSDADEKKKIQQEELVNIKKIQATNRTRRPDKRQLNPLLDTRKKIKKNTIHTKLNTGPVTALN